MVYSLRLRCYDRESAPILIYFPEPFDKSQILNEMNPSERIACFESLEQLKRTMIKAALPELVDVGEEESAVLHLTKEQLRVLGFPVESL